MAPLEHLTTTRAQTFRDAVRVRGHRDDVLNHPDLSMAEKCEVLAGSDRTDG